MIYSFTKFFHFGSNTRRTLGVILALTLSFVLSNCKTNRSDSQSDSKDFRYPGVISKSRERHKAWNLAYKYQGPMPQLENTEIFISYNGRTLRVEGEPIDSNGNKLSQSEIEDLQTNQGLDYLYRLKNTNRYFVVYPIAVGKNSQGEPLSKRCRKCTFEGEGNYKFIRISPRRGFQSKSGSFAAHSWHLMPYIGYGKGSSYGSYAFHSPYTSATIEVNGKSVKMLHLRRGAVSGGCKRMVPEHIIEITHILGINTDVKLGTRYGTKNGIDFPEILQELNNRGMNSETALEANKDPNDFTCREKMLPGQRDCFIHVKMEIDTVELADGSMAEVDVSYPSWGNRPKHNREKNTLFVHKTSAPAERFSRPAEIPFPA